MKTVKQKTIRKRSEEDFCWDRNRLRSLFDNMTEGFALFKTAESANGSGEADYRFIEVNDAFETLTGLKRENIINKLRSSILQGGDARFTKIYGEVAHAGIPVRFTDYSKKLERYYDILAFRPEKGYVAILFKDVTVQKQQDAAKNNFIAVMSHELRNPLMPILTNTEILNAYLSENSPKRRRMDPKIKEAVEGIARQAKTLGKLLDDLLDIARIIRGKIILNKKPINLYTSVKNAIEAAKPLLDSQKHTFSSSFPFFPIYIDADPIRIEQIITNLLNNAAKYTKPGGRISLTVEKKEDGAVLIKVRDTGIGIKPEDMNKLFELFMQFSKPFVETRGDFGIGLKIIKDIVEMHGGTISAQSDGVDKGSEFVVSLPTISRPAETEEKPQEEPLSKRKILVVDDNKDISDSLNRLLTYLGHEVAVANDGKEALSETDGFTPDIVLLDIGLPDMSGYEVAGSLREKYGTALKIVALTGYGQEKDKSLAKEAGFDYHLTKPVSIGDINEVIKKCFP